MLLDVLGNLLGVLLLQCLYRLVVGLELSKLLLVLLHAAIEATLELLDLAFEISDLRLMFLLKLLLFGQKSLLILLELLQTFSLLVSVLLLQLSDLLLPSVALLRLLNLLFLARDDVVGTAEEGFNFFFICVLDSRLHGRILLVLAVQMEDHLGQLGDLLRHLVMCLFVHLQTPSLSLTSNLFS